MSSEQPIHFPKIWHESLSIDGGETDKEHKHHLDVISRILHAKDMKIPRMDVSALFYELTNHLVLHCFHEEILMSKVDYPDRDKHVKEHHSIFEIVATLGASIEKNDEDSEGKFFHYICGYVVNHINTHDRALATFCRDQSQLTSMAS